MLNQEPILLPACKLSLSISKSFLISTCIQVSPAHTSTQVTSSKNMKTDVHVEHNPEPRLQKQKYATCLNSSYIAGA